jgi:YD repeat-containing protein
VDSSLRNDRFSDYVKLKLLTKPELTFGTEFTSHQFSSQRIRYEREGYIRSFDSGRTEFFDLRGKLVQVHDKNANSIMLSYDSRGNLAGILDNFGRKIEISIDSRGLVQQLRDPARNRTVEFKYNDKLELIYSKDVDGNEYHFDYDSKGRHNLTQIGYSDKTSVDVEYYGSEMHENVKNVKDRDGTRMAYEYVSADHNHLKVTVAVSGSDGKKLSTSIYSYVFADFNGQEVTAKIIADVDGDRTETDYDPSSNLPIRIQKGNEVTRFQYDRDGHVTLKATTEQVTEMTYDLYSHKVSQVKIYPPGKPEKATWSKFSYDDHGNLLSAQNSKSIEIKLEYDGNGRITEIIQKDGSRLQFQYNVSSKPTEIVWVAPDKTKEAIKVEYGDDGEIKNVSSPQGRSVSLKVTNAYQQLLDIIRPAGVSLNF